MAANLTRTPSFQVEQAKKALIAFYQKPVAQVSTELFFTIGAIIFFALFAIRPTIVTMTELVKEIEDKEKLNTALAKKVTALASVSTEYFAIQNELEVIDEVVPESVTPEKVLKIIERTASEHQVVISSLRLKEIPPTQESENEIPFSNKQPHAIPIVINVEGTYEPIRQFIEDLTSIRPLLTVETLHFAPSTEGGGDTISNQLSATFTVLTHHYAEGDVASEDENKDNASTQDVQL